MKGNKIQLVATGRGLIGRGIRSFHSVMEEILLDAEEEIVIAAYTISGNLKDLLVLLEDAAAKGVRISIILNKIESQPQNVVKLLEKLSTEYPHMRIYDFQHEIEDLHMKVIIADRRRAIIGSANLTWKGMVENLELGVFIEGGLAENVSRIIDEIRVFCTAREQSF